MKFYSVKYTWKDIPASTKKRIKEDLNIVNKGLKDRKEALVRLFEDFNTYMGGNYGSSSVTCGKCVTNVMKTFNRRIENYG